MLLNQMRNNTTMCSFIKVGCPSGLYRKLAHVPHIELMQAISTATFGAYLGAGPDVVSIWIKYLLAKLICTEFVQKKCNGFPSCHFYLFLIGTDHTSVKSNQCLVIKLMDFWYNHFASSVMFLKCHCLWGCNHLACSVKFLKCNIYKIHVVKFASTEKLKIFIWLWVAVFQLYLHIQCYCEVYFCIKFNNLLLKETQY